MEVLAYYHADSNACVQIPLLTRIFFLTEVVCDRNHPLVRYEFNEIKAAIEYDRTGQCILVVLFPQLMPFQLLPTSVTRRSFPHPETWSGWESLLRLHSFRNGPEMVSSHTISTRSFRTLVLLTRLLRYRLFLFVLVYTLTLSFST